MPVRNRLFDAVGSDTKVTATTVSAAASALKTATARAKKSYKSPATMLTDNGAIAKKGTGSKVLDMFAKGGTYRTATPSDIIDLIEPALKEEPALFGACLFYLRDILEGQGERRFFRTVLYFLGTVHPQVAYQLFELIPQYGRWDDLFAFRGTFLYDAALQFYADALQSDYNLLLIDPNASISLAGKWAPSEKAGKAAKTLWRDLVVKFDSPAQYRRLLTRLRARIRIVESAMCAKEWGSIDYGKVPSRASLLYRKAFKKNDSSRYAEFIASLKGKSKEEVRKSIKAGALYPYELVSQCNMHNYGTPSNQDDDTIDALWNAMPDYLKGKHRNSLAVVDTSGSMSSPVTGTVTALQIAISIGLYLADNAQGIWAGKFITFSTNPSFQTVEGDTLQQKVLNMASADWHMSTNLNKVFTLILETAKKHELGQEDMPETVFVISDMQFDEASRRSDTNFDQITRQYEAAGYERPNLVFWAVKKGEASPVAYNDYGTAVVSGFSANTFSNVMGDEYVTPPTPEEVMRKVLESPRYQSVRDIFSQIQ